MSDVETCCNESEVYLILNFLKTSKTSVPDDISAKILNIYIAGFATSSINELFNLSPQSDQIPEE